MGAGRYLISSQTVGAGGVSVVTFSSIPQTYTDLSIKISARSSSTAGRVSSGGIRFNSATTNQSDRTVRGTGAATGSFSNTYTSTGYMYIGEFPTTTATASVFTNTEIYIPNYTSSNFKSYSCDSTQEDNQAIAYDSLISGLWSSTSAITQIDLYAISWNILQYSTISLYGINKS